MTPFLTRAERARALKRKGEQCQFCGALPGQWATSFKDGHTYLVKIHVIPLDMDRTNKALDNLAPTCQRCHNQHNRDHRAKLAYTRRERQKAEKTGQEFLIDPEEAPWTPKRMRPSARAQTRNPFLPTSISK